MPFSALRRRQASSADLRTCPPNTIYASSEWHEQAMDFTTYADIDQTTRLSRVNNKSMNVLPRDYFRSAEMDKSSAPASASDMFSTGPFGFSNLINMDSNTISPLDISSASSVQSDSQSEMRTSRCAAFRAEGNNTLPLLSEQMCPLITGDTDVCEPSRCGPNAPCMNFTNILPIEDCASVPCVQTAAPSIPIEIPIRNLTRASSRIRRPMQTRKRAQTPLSTSSSEDRKSRFTPHQRPTATPTSSAPEKSLSRLDKKQRAKQAHSLVEKKYRENLNTKLLLLHTTLQNARYGPNRFNDSATNDTDVELDDDHNIKASDATSNTELGLSGGSKFRKSEVLDDAMSYVNQTEVELRHMEAELIRLTERTEALERALQQSAGGTRPGKKTCGDSSLLKRTGSVQMQMQVGT